MDTYIENTDQMTAVQYDGANAADIADRLAPHLGQVKQATDDNGDLLLYGDFGDTTLWFTLAVNDWVLIPGLSLLHPPQFPPRVVPDFQFRTNFTPVSDQSAAPASSPSDDDTSSPSESTPPPSDGASSPSDPASDPAAPVPDPTDATDLTGATSTAAPDASGAPTGTGPADPAGTPDPAGTAASDPATPANDGTGA